MTDIPEFVPEGLGDEPIDPSAPHPNECEKHREMREYLGHSKDTPFEEMAKALVKSHDADMQGTIEVVMQANPKHPTVACAAMSYFIHFVKEGIIRFGTEEQQERVVKDMRESLGIFAHLADPETLPD